MNTVLRIFSHSQCKQTISCSSRYVSKTCWIFVLFLFVCTAVEFIIKHVPLSAIYEATGIVITGNLLVLAGTLRLKTATATTSTATTTTKLFAWFPCQDYFSPYQSSWHGNQHNWKSPKKKLTQWRVTVYSDIRLHVQVWGNGHIMLPPHLALNEV